MPVRQMPVTDVLNIKIKFTHDNKAIITLAKTIFRISDCCNSGLDIEHVPSTKHQR